MGEYVEGAGVDGGNVEGADCGGVRTCRIIEGRGACTYKLLLKAPFVGMGFVIIQVICSIEIKVQKISFPLGFFLEIEAHSFIISRTY